MSKTLIVEKEIQLDGRVKDFLRGSPKKLFIWWRVCRVCLWGNI